MSTKSEVETSIDTNLPTNGSEAIGASHIRSEIKEVLDFANEITLRSISVDSTATSDDQIILADSSAGDVTVTLPPAADMPESSIRVIKYESSNAVGVIPDGVETINGSIGSVFVPAQWDSLVLYSTGTEWIIL